MRLASEQSVAELNQRIAELTARVAELTRRVELAEGVGLDGNGSSQPRTVSDDWPAEITVHADDSLAETAVHSEDDRLGPIEFVTENGFAIVRPWEAASSRAPSEGRCCFQVDAPGGEEREVFVEIADEVGNEMALRTRGRIQLSNPFWICCAERQLAKYLETHDDFPNGNELIVESLDAEEIILAMRWGKNSDEW